jgi:FMN phosphatase YigB (HAD superfamily)
MKKVFNQQFTKGGSITCWYGKPPKDIFQYDVIRLKLGKKDDIYITPDEASCIIRALSAGLSHYLVEEDKCAKAKGV